MKYISYNENRQKEEITMIKYELLLENVKEVSKDKLKEIVRKEPKRFCNSWIGAVVTHNPFSFFH